MVTIEEFREKYQQRGMSVMQVADLVTRVNLPEDREFERLAREAVEAEDRFYIAMLERGLEQ